MCKLVCTGVKFTDLLTQRMRVKFMVLIKQTCENMFSDIYTDQNNSNEGWIFLLLWLENWLQSIKIIQINKKCDCVPRINEGWKVFMLRLKPTVFYGVNIR